MQNWKKEFLENASRVFSQKRDEKEAQQKAIEAEERERELMAKVGQLTVEMDWLKKTYSNVRAGMGEQNRLRQKVI